jgi:hypothetical protein
LGKVYKNSVGVDIIVSTGIDLTNATSTVFRVRKPSETEVTWNATVVDATNGILRYTTTTNDLNEAGVYYLQPLVTFTNRILYGKTATFEVYAPFT